MKSAFLIINLILTTFLFAQTYWGEGIKVISGDQFQMKVKGVILTIRLNGIDCPEEGQNYFKEAKDFTTQKVLARQVIAERVSEDRFGVIFANVRLSDGSILNELLLKNGLAWAYQKVLSDYTYKKLENDAKRYKVGLWQDNYPIPPWQYRMGVRTKPEKEIDLSDKEIYRGKKGFYYIDKFGRRVYISSDQIK